MTKEKKTELFRAIKYTLFAASAGIIQIGSFTLLTELTPLSYWPCYLISLALSVVWNFTFNRKFTFKSANNVPIAMLKVAAYYAVFTPLSTLGGDWLVETAHWNEYLVEVLSMLVNFITEFLYQRFFVFGKSIDTAEKKKEEGQKAPTTQEDAAEPPASDKKEKSSDEQ